jgi:hypothetical protein
MREVAVNTSPPPAATLLVLAKVMARTHSRDTLTVFTRRVKFAPPANRNGDAEALLRGDRHTHGQAQRFTQAVHHEPADPGHVHMGPSPAHKHAHLTSTTIEVHTPTVVASRADGSRRGRRRHAARHGGHVLGAADEGGPLEVVGQARGHAVRTQQCSVQRTDLGCGWVGECV